MTPSTPPPPRPALVVVTGRPGSGKSTLAPLLGRALRCPVISRDEIKEGLIHTAGGASPAEHELTRRATEAFFETVEILLGRGVSLVVEAAFQHRVWAPRLEPLRDLARIRVVLCSLDAELARTRRHDRASSDPLWERFHPEPATPTGRPAPYAEYDPPRLDVPTLEVNTTDGHRPALEVVVAFARGAEAGA